MVPRQQLRYVPRVTATVLIALLLATSLWQLASAGWIQARSVIAQQLLQQAWQQGRRDGNNHRPWPWADTWPAARLEVPALDINQIVLAGDNTRALAFGPGMSFAGARPDETGTTLISGHRDTHFRFLQKLEAGDRIILHTASSRQHFAVEGFKIVDSRSFRLPIDLERKTLVLSTCYPFDAINHGGTERYLVFASLAD